MTLDQLQNLVKVKQLKPEPPDQAEPEGHLEVTPQLLEELVSISGELLQKVEALGPVR